MIRGARGYLGYFKSLIFLGKEIILGPEITGVLIAQILHYKKQDEVLTFSKGFFHKFKREMKRLRSLKLVQKGVRKDDHRLWLLDFKILEANL